MHHIKLTDLIDLRKLKKNWRKTDKKSSIPYSFQVSKVILVTATTVSVVQETKHLHLQPVYKVVKLCQSISQYVKGR